jgi:hypothetical protein
MRISSSLIATVSTNSLRYAFRKAASSLANARVGIALARQSVLLPCGATITDSGSIQVDATRCDWSWVPLSGLRPIGAASAGPQCPARLEPAETRHDHIDQNEVRSEFLRQLQQHGAIRRRPDHVELLL